MSNEKVGRLFTGTLFTILISHTGAKLAPFNSGGVCQNCPAKTDDALQQIFYFWPLFFPKMLKIFFPDIRKKGQKIFPDINQLN
jgi:hypothetical protein